MTDIYKLMERYGITNGLENDQRRLDAFVKELEEVTKGVIGGDIIYVKPPEAGKWYEELELITELVSSVKQDQYKTIDKLFHKGCK